MYDSMLLDKGLTSHAIYDNQIIILIVVLNDPTNKHSKSNENSHLSNILIITPPSAYALLSLSQQ